jgi:hypothetical protein
MIMEILMAFLKPGPRNFLSRENINALVKRRDRLRKKKKITL